MNVTTLPKPPRVGLVSLGCPKNLVDSERIMPLLQSTEKGLRDDAMDGTERIDPVLQWHRRSFLAAFKAS